MKSRRLLDRKKQNGVYLLCIGWHAAGRLLCVLCDGLLRLVQREASAFGMMKKGGEGK